MMEEHPRTYVFRRARRRGGSNGTPSTATESSRNSSPPSVFLTVPDAATADDMDVARASLALAASQSIMKSPETYKMKRLDLHASVPRAVTFAVPFSPPQTFTMRRGYRPESAPRNFSSAAAIAAQNTSLYPETYRFRRSRDGGERDEEEMDTDTTTLGTADGHDDRPRGDRAPTSNPMAWYRPLPPESYRFTRMDVRRSPATAGGNTDSDSAQKRAAEERRRRRQEEEDAQYREAPRSYTFNTSYLRAEPKGTFADKRVPARPTATEAAAAAAAKRRPTTTCGCLFFAYHGYCDHGDDTRRYYNVDPESHTGEYIAWQEYTAPSSAPSSSSSSSAWRPSAPVPLGPRAVDKAPDHTVVRLPARGVDTLLRGEIRVVGAGTGAPAAGGGNKPSSHAHQHQQRRLDDTAGYGGTKERGMREGSRRELLFDDDVVEDDDGDGNGAMYDDNDVDDWTPRRRTYEDARQEKTYISRR